jgi:hypothetical protein
MDLLSLEHRIENPRAALTAGGMTQRWCPLSDSKFTISQYDPNLLPEELRQFSIDPSTGCWVWEAGMRGQYGYVRGKHKYPGAHRVIFEFFCGPIAHGHVAHHDCRNKRCVNPSHIRALDEQSHRREHAPEIKKRRYEETRARWVELGLIDG